MESDGFSQIDGLELTEPLEKALAGQGITTPTDVQRFAIPPLLAGQSAVLHSGTGTGKTLAFLLPLLQRLRHAPQDRAVILSSSTELAIQTLRTAELCDDGSLSMMALVGSANRARQRKRLRKQPRLIVGTAGSILEAFPPGRLPKGAAVLVVDEPDPVLSERNERGLLLIADGGKGSLQVVVAGATLGPRAEEFIRRSTSDDVFRTDYSTSPLQTNIAHGVVTVPSGQGKDVCLARLLGEHRPRQAVVFVRREEHLRHLYRFLSAQGLSVVTVSAQRSKGDCRDGLAAFRAGKAKILITHDGMGRGLDIPRLPWVVHYDLPSSAQAYVHRAGRTGRAGHQGQSVAVVTAKERPVLEGFARELGIELSPFSPQKRQGKRSSPRAGKPSSPRGGKASSPRAGKPSSPRGGKPSSPRGGKASSPRAGKPSAVGSGTRRAGGPGHSVTSNS